MKFLLLFAVCVSAFAHDDSGAKGDSGIFGPTYDKLLEMAVDLRNQYPNVVSTIDYGNTVGGRTMRMIVLKKPNWKGPRTTVILDGTIHGNEYLNIEDRAPAALAALSGLEGPVKSFLDKGGVFLFVPIINPDGYVNRRRENNNGKDLNRDWDVPSISHKGFTQPETKLLAEKIKQLKSEWNLNLQLNVDYHCCAGAAMHPRAYNSSKIPAADYERHLKLGALAPAIIGSDYDTWYNVLGYYAKGTTLDYFFEVHGTHSFTFEGEYGEENTRFQKHLEWWLAMLDRIS